MALRWITASNRGPITGVGRAPAWAALWAVVMLYLLAVLLWGWWVAIHTGATYRQLPPGQSSASNKGIQWRVQSLARVQQPPEEYEPTAAGTTLVRAELVVRRSGEELCDPALVGRDGRRFEQLIDYDLDGAQYCSDLPAGVEQTVSVLYEVPSSELDSVYGVVLNPTVEVGRNDVLRPPA